MCWREKALTGILLVLLILSLTFGPIWFMAFPILLGMIASAVNRAVEIMKTKPILPVYGPAPAVDAPVDALAPAVDAPVDALAPAVDALALSVDAPVDTPAISVDAPVDAADAPVDAPAPAVDALALSVDALVDAPAISVDAPVDAPALSIDAPVDALDFAPAVVAAGIRKRRKRESSSTPSSSYGFEHDVYLNFRGLDTRNGFTDHLCHALRDAGMKVFIDDGELHPVEELGSKLKGAIKRSRISIAIFSINYASSTRCLNELVQMWECRESNGQIIIPIFYNVNPSDVRHQAGDFGRSFNLHEMDRFDSITIETWRDALRKIGSLSGFHRDGREAQLVKEVVALVAQLLKRDDQVVTDKLVGIDRHVQEMMRKLGVDNSKGQAIEVRGEEVRVVGICGEPGVGKTTLAKVVFNKMHKLFDACSFLEGISSEEIEFSQRMLIADLHKIEPAPLKSIHEGIEEIASLCRNAKVLVVLDDVREDEQIKALAGKLTWFGLGSRIIVTTTKRNVLNAFDDGALDIQTVEEYNLVPMKDHHALQLFREHAFAGEAPEDVSEFDSLSTDIVKAIGGLPSDIVRHASFFRDNRNIDIWKASLDILQKKTQKIGNLPF